MKVSRPIFELLLNVPKSIGTIRWQTASRIINKLSKRSSCVPRIPCDTKKHSLACACTEGGYLPFLQFCIEDKFEQSRSESGRELLSNAHDQKFTAQTSCLIYISAAIWTLRFCMTCTK